MSCRPVLHSWKLFFVTIAVIWPCQSGMAQVTINAIVTTGNSGLNENLAPGVPGGKFNNANNNNALNGFGSAGALNNSGEVTFLGSLTGLSGINGSNNTGIWSNSAGNLHLAAREGDIMPTLAPHIFGDFENNRPQLNDAGTTVFAGYNSSGSVSGVFRHSTSGGLQAVITTTDSVPGRSGAAFTGFYTPGLNNSGEVAFRATTSQGTGIWSNVSGSFEKVAFVGETAPGAGAAAYASLEVMDRVTFNDAGHVQYRATLVGDGVNTANDVGLWSNAGGSSQLLAREGDALPAVGAGVSLEVITPSVAFNAADHSAMRASLTGVGVTTANNLAILSDRGGSGWEVVARKGSAAPVGASGEAFSSFDSNALAFNDSGQVQFISTLSGTNVTTSNDRAVFSEGPGGMQMVAREGQVAPGANALFGHNPELSGADNTFSTIRFNNAGQTAFIGHLGANFTDRTNQGIWATDPFGTLQLVVRRNSTVLDFRGSGTLLSPTRNFDSLILGEFNDQGQLTFSARAQNDTGTTSLFMADLGSANVASGEVVEISNGRQVIVPGGVTVGDSQGSSSVLQLGGGSTVQANQTVQVLPSATIQIDATSMLTAPQIDVSGYLQLNGSIIGDVFLQEGGAISGTGSVQGTVYAADGSIITIGNSPGELLVDNLVFETGTHSFEFEIKDAAGEGGMDWDLLTVDGNLDFGVGATINIDLNSLDANDTPGVIANFDSEASYSWMLSSAASITGFTNAIFVIDASDFMNPITGAFSVSQQGNEIRLLYSPSMGVPGDFDGDGDIDGRDLLAWQRGESPNPFSSGDLELWQAEYDTVPLAASVAIPEQSTTILLLSLAVMSTCKRRS